MLNRIFQKISRILGSKSDTTLSWFERDFDLFQQLNLNGRFTVDRKDFYPCLNDHTVQTDFDAHYIYHPAWAARIIRDINPDLHVDISSTLHFCSILSAFIKTAFYDFRPADLQLSNLTSLHADLTRLHFENDSLSSLSCMHTLEHIGLGRYGDAIDPDGDLKAINELKRVCAKNGTLLIVVPVGIKKIMFNAHRIYDPTEFRDYFVGFTLERFSLVTDERTFIEDASFELAATQQYGCGCYWFKKVLH